MTVPDPEDHDRRKDAAPHNSPEEPQTPTSNAPGRYGSPAGADAGSADAAATDAAFASIIADFREDPDLPSWPDDGAQDGAGQPPPAPPPFVAAGDRRPDAAEDDHYQPPEPPPMPVPRPRTMGGLLLLALGILLLVRPSVITLNASVGTPLGLLALTAGIGWLVLGLRSGPPPEGWDDGARL